MLPLLAGASYGWNPFALPWLALSLALMALAGFILARQKASRVGVLFCFMIALASVWLGAFGAMFSSTAAPVALIWGRLGLAAVCLLPAAIHDFTATALRLQQRRALVRTFWILGALFALSSLVTPGMAAGVSLERWGWYPRAGVLALPFLLLFVVALGLQLLEGFTELRRSRDPLRRNRITRLMLAFVVAYFAAIDFAPMFGLPMRPIGFIPVIAFVLFAWKPIRRHRLPAITAARASREILETMADALFVIDAEARIRVVNGAVGSLLGHEEAELLGRSIDTLEHVAGDRTISRTLREMARREPIREQERILRHKKGHSIAVSISISQITEGDVQHGAVIIARDIRTRKAAEEELRETMRRLEQSNRELEDFAYVASHDLQEPLRKIQAFGDLLKSKHAQALDPQARDYIDRMQSAARRMQVLIDDLLSFSRITTRAQPFTSVDLGEVGREVARDLEMRMQESGGRLVIGELPVIEADRMQMHQLLQNLFSNGLKFHRPGVPPVVEVRGSADLTRARLEISDNGIGFESKYAERIFTMFERLHSRAAYEGTGIGLAICKKIVERHGGTIEATSSPGEGSTFTVTLPIWHAPHD